MLEASAFGLRWIVGLLKEHGVAVDKLVGTGGLPHNNPLLVQIYADVLGQPITVHPSKQGSALGAAILGVLAAGKQASGFSSPAGAIRTMAAPRKNVPGREPILVRPQKNRQNQYESVYQDYRNLADLLD
jgi:L-ribulokinase